MSDRVKFVLNAALALATLFLTSVLWHYPIALIALLVVTAAGIHAIRPSATNVVVYMTGFVFGPLAEAVSISTGAWEYDTTHLLGVPVWLPFVWGNAALFIQNMAELWKSLLAPSSRRRTVADRVTLDRGPGAADQPPDGDGNPAPVREPARSV